MIEVEISVMMFEQYGVNMVTFSEVHEGINPVIMGLCSLISSILFSILFVRFTQTRGIWLLLVIILTYCSGSGLENRRG